MSGALLRLLFTLAAMAVAPQVPAVEDLRLGSALVAGAPRGSDKPPPAASGRVEGLQRTPAQTNQWYSSLLFHATPEPLYAQPLSAKPVAGGLEVALPMREAVPTERRDLEIHYTHRHPVLVSSAAVAAAPPKLARATDWAVDIEWAGASERLRATVAHGSPYVHFRASAGDLRLRLPAAAVRSPLPVDDRTLVLTAEGRRFAFFGPAGVRWRQLSDTEWVAVLPPGGRFLSVAFLPDDREATLALLARHAYAFLADTRVEGRYDSAASQVQTTFTATVETMQGEPVPPLLGLYPHHWFRNASVEGRLGPAYDTVRGPIRLLAATGFQTTKPFHGFVPWWPAVDGGARKEELRDVMRTDLRNARRMMLEIGNGPYWQGKGLQRIGKLLDVVQAQGDAEGSARLLELLKGRMEQWFAGGSRKTYFHLDRTIGTVAAYPEEYFSVEQMNDHHFHYGYWIRAAAEVALRDPEWALPERWGGIVDLLVADIATSTRGDARFPYLRTFDAYEGHSWASGVGLGAHGNNQESSSEAINAWAALILWGEVTGRRELRDLGAWLYASEIDAVQHYWFDVHGLVFAPEYRAMRQEASMVFGGKYAHNTWWTDEPRQIKGINLLPVTTASVHLARDPAYVKRSLGALDAEVANWLGRGKRYADVPRDIWQDIFAKVQALVDPAAALTQWNRWGAVELGDSRSHTLHWMLSLQEMGVPDLSVTADTPLHGVFRRPDGRRTYLAFNAGTQPLEVRFSDGTTITVGPRSLGRRSN